MAKKKNKNSKNSSNTSNTSNTLRNRKGKGSNTSNELNESNGSNGVSSQESLETSGVDAEAKKNAVTYLNILADTTHNFTDGLTIAASFIISSRMGLIQSLAILLHEVPHEIGDYAILIENGMSASKAALVQVLTAVGCLVGTILGFLAENSDFGTKWIIPFTSGGFIYIACVQVMPSLAERKFGTFQSFLQLVGFTAGVALMVLVGWVEENIDHFL